jgi:dTMP kinase
MSAAGRFIALEGGEACGKSTQAVRLAGVLDAVLTREPGGTIVGERIRELFLYTDEAVAPRTEALLVAAARAQHVAQVIRPALDAGRHVVSDRYLGSSLAYQGFGRGLPVEEIRMLSEWATEGLWPDLIVLLDVPDDVAQARIGGRGLDRMESAGDDFHQRVADGFRSLAANDPSRWVVIDGSGPVDAVGALVAEAVRERLRLPA